MASKPYRPWSYKETGWVQEGHKSPLYCVAFNHFPAPPGAPPHLAACGGSRCTVFAAPPGGGLRPVQAYADADAGEDFFVCAWGADAGTGAPLLLLGGARRVLRVVDAARGALTASLEGHGDAINDAAPHPTRPHLVATASRDRSLRVWSLAERACVLVLAGDGGHRSEVLTCDWRPGTGGGAQAGALLASAGMDGCVKVWGLAEHEGVLAAAAAWAAAGRGAAGGSAAFAVRHVRAPLLSTRAVHRGGYVDCVRWAGDLIASKSVDDRILVWRPGGGVGGGSGGGGGGGGGGGVGAAGAGAKAGGGGGGGGAGGAGARGGGGSAPAAADIDLTGDSGDEAAPRAPAPPRGAGDALYAALRAGGGDGDSGPHDRGEGRGAPVAALALEGCRETWWLRFGLDAGRRVLAAGSAAGGRVLVFDVLAACGAVEPRCRLRPRRAAGRADGGRGLLVRQAAVSAGGAVVVAAHEDGSLTRWDAEPVGEGEAPGEGADAPVFL